MVKRGLTAVVVAAAAALVGTQALAQGNPAEGEKVFKKCVACHAAEAGKNKVGPSLHGIVGRKAGTVEGFKYSKAMQEADLAWTEENIAKYLEKPRDFIPGNRMAFAGLPKKEDRENVIAYLKTLQ